MEEKEILELIGVTVEEPSELSELIGSEVQYCSNIAHKQNESNYFVVNNNITTIRYDDKGSTAYIKEHTKDDYDRPVGAKYFIKQGDGNYKRSNTVNPSYWNTLKKNNDYVSFFRRGHLIASTFGGDKKMSDTNNRGKLSQFIQTKWSNENDNGRNPYCQWHFEEVIKSKVEEASACMASRPIYRNKADIIPIGVHLQAVTAEESLFNVFLPNIDPNIVIDYKKCTFQPRK